MAGTWASYQGHPCVDVDFVRSRGLEPDTSIVEIIASPDLELEAPQESSLAKREAPERRTFEQILDDAAAPSDLVPGALLKPEGTLVCAEVLQGQLRALAIAGLFVLRLELARRGEAPEAVVWRVYLVDERFFWPLGLEPRWSYNRVRADGKSFAIDSLDQASDPPIPFPTSKLVAAELVARLFRAPTVSAMPSSWGTDYREWRWRPFEPAVQAIRTVVDAMGVEPCLRLDGTLAFHEPGDGVLGADGVAVPGSADVDPSGVPSGSNAKALPADLRPWLRGTGHGRALEFGYPERYLVVVGGVRVATVALDAWEPVLVIHGRPVPLTEQTIRMLTVGRHGLEWLHKWLVQPPAHQHAVGVTEAVLDLLRSQAYRLYRLPGAVVYDAAVRETLLKAKVEALKAAGIPEAQARQIASSELALAQVLNPVADGDARPGRNAHLLPLERRAEVDGRGRMDVTVRIYRYVTKSRTFDDRTAESEAVGEAVRELASLSTQIRDAAAIKSVPDPWNLTNKRLEAVPMSLRLELVAKSFGFANAFGKYVGGEDWERARQEAIAVDRIQAIDPALAARYEAALKKKLDAEDKLNGTGNAELYELAKPYAAVNNDRPQSQIRATVEALRRLDERVGQLLAEKRQVEAAGGRLGTSIGGVYFENLDRADDLGASVYSEDLGIIRTSCLAGHLLDPDVHDSGSTTFVPLPVRVLFGATVRPRTDRPLGTPSGTPSGAVAKAEPDVVPEALSDRETIFRAVYERVGRGLARPVPDADVTDEVLRAAARLERPDLAELVPIAAAGNRAALLAQAQDAAATLFRRQDVLRSETLTMLGPWAVNPDGVVSTVRVQMRHDPESGAPCGFLTTVTTGSSAFKTRRQGTQERAPRPRGPEDDRERLRP